MNFVNIGNSRMPVLLMGHLIHHTEELELFTNKSERTIFYVVVSGRLSSHRQKRGGIFERHRFRGLRQTSTFVLNVNIFNIYKQAFSWGTLVKIFFHHKHGILEFVEMPLLCVKKFKVRFFFSLVYICSRADVVIVSEAADRRVCCMSYSLRASHSTFLKTTVGNNTLTQQSF